MSLYCCRMGLSPFSFSLDGLLGISCELQTPKYNSPKRQRNNFPFVEGMVSPSLWLSLRQFSFHPRTVLFASAFSRSLEVSLTYTFTNVLLSPSCFQSGLVVGDRLCIIHFDIFDLLLAKGSISNIPRRRSAQLLRLTGARSQP